MLNRKNLKFSNFHKLFTKIDAKTADQMDDTELAGALGVSVESLQKVTLFFREVFKLVLTKGMGSKINF